MDFPPVTMAYIPRQRGVRCYTVVKPCARCGKPWKKRPEHQMIRRWCDACIAWRDAGCR